MGSEMCIRDRGSEKCRFRRVDLREIGQGAEEHKGPVSAPWAPMLAVPGPVRIGGARKVENQWFP